MNIAGDALQFHIAIDLLNQNQSGLRAQLQFGLFRNDQLKNWLRLHEARRASTSEVALMSMRSPTCSDSMETFPGTMVLVTTTSEFFQDFTSIRPLTILLIMTIGWSLTVK